MFVLSLVIYKLDIRKLKKFFIVNSASVLPALIFFVRNLLNDTHTQECGLFLRFVSIYLAINFLISLIGFFSLFLINRPFSENFRFMDPKNLKVKPDNELNNDDLALRDWFTFLSKMLAFSLFSLVAFAFVSSYIFDTGICARP